MRARARAFLRRSPSGRVPLRVPVQSDDGSFRRVARRSFGHFGHICYVPPPPPIASSGEQRRARRPNSPRAHAHTSLDDDGPLFRGHPRDRRPGYIFHLVALALAQAACRHHWGVALTEAFKFCQLGGGPPPLAERLKRNAVRARERECNCNHRRRRTCQLERPADCADEDEHERASDCELIVGHQSGV